MHGVHVLSNFSIVLFSIAVLSIKVHAVNHHNYIFIINHVLHFYALLDSIHAGHLISLS